MAQGLALLPHSKKVPGSNLNRDVSVWSLHVVRVGLLQVLRFPPTVQKHGGRLIGDSKLPIGVNGCLSLYVSPVMTYR